MPFLLRRPLLASRLLCSSFSAMQPCTAGAGTSFTLEGPPRALWPLPSRIFTASNGSLAASLPRRAAFVIPLERRRRPCERLTAVGSAASSSGRAASSQLAAACSTISAPAQSSTVLQGSTTLPAIAKQQPGRVGDLHVIKGPMFSGKTTELLSVCRTAEQEGNNVLYVKSDKDVRYSKMEITTHTGVKQECYSVSMLARLEQDNPEAYKACTVIGIDEAQFFPDLVDFCIRAVELHGKTVYAAGLDTDFKRKAFGQVLELTSLATSTSQRYGKCGCNARSLFSQRLPSVRGEALPPLGLSTFLAPNTRNRRHSAGPGWGPLTQVELVGGADIYRPACRKCFVQPHADEER